MRVVYEATLSKKEGEWTAGVPGAIAVLGAIGFGVGVIDENMRQMLPELLVGCLVATVAGGLLYWRASKRLARTLRVLRGEGGALRVELLEGEEVALTLEAPTIAHGVFTDLVLVGASNRSVPVAWVKLSDEAGRSVTVRKGYGVLDRVPAWPSARYLERDAGLFGGDAEALYLRLAAAPEAKAGPKKRAKKKAKKGAAKGRPEASTQGGEREDG